VLWTVHIRSLRPQGLNDVRFGANEFMAVGDGVINSVDATAYRSFDGTNWSFMNMPTTNNLHGVAKGPGTTWVAVGEAQTEGNSTAGAVVLTTTNEGASWSVSRMPFTNPFHGIVYDEVEGQYVAILGPSTTDTTPADRIAISPDGQNWTFILATTSFQFARIERDNGFNVAVATDGKIFVIDPAALSVTVPFTSTANAFHDITYGNDAKGTPTWVVVGNNTANDIDAMFTNTASNPATSSWNSLDPLAFGGLEAMNYSNGTFVAVGDTGRVYISRAWAPSIATPVVNQNGAVGLGLNTTFTVEAQPSAPAGYLGYQWQSFNGTVWSDLTSGANFTGVNTVLLTVENVSIPDAVPYRVEVTNAPVNSQLIYVSNNGNNSVSKVSIAGVPSNFASTAGPVGLALDTSGNLYVTNLGQGNVTRITPSGNTSVYATGLVHPQNLAFDTAGNLYITSNGGIAKVPPGGGNATTFVPASAFATGAFGLAFNSTGTLFVTGSPNIIYEVAPAGSVSTFVNSPDFSGPNGLAFDSQGNLYVSNLGGYVSEISPSGNVTTFATGFDQPTSVAFDFFGNLYVTNSDPSNNTISEVTQSGTVTTFASGFSAPFGLAITPITGTTLLTNNATIALSVPPLITQGPANVTLLAAGGNATFTVTASGVPAPTYQWRLNGVPLTDNGNVAGSNTTTLTLTNVQVSNSTLGPTAGVYSVMATNDVGSATASAILTVNSPVMILTQPQSQVPAIGANVSLSVVATGIPPPTTYQWYFNGVALTNNGTISGANTSTLNINPMAAKNIGSYTVTVSNGLSSATSAVASIGTLAVYFATEPHVTTPTPPANTTVTSIQVPAITTVVISSLAVATPPPAYQWYRNGVAISSSSVFSGVNSANLTIKSIPVGDSGVFTAVATSGSSPPANSTAVTITVGPQITTQPKNLTVLAFALARFTVTVSTVGTGPISYQWYINGVPAVNGGFVTGATTKTLTISHAGAQYAGTYYVIVSCTASGSVPTKSTVVKLTIKPQPN
jgi:sugar lactone lactonase YvrE